MTDLVERDGLEYYDTTIAWGQKTLTEFGWEFETGLPTETAHIDESTTLAELQKQGENSGKAPEQRKAEIDEAVATINKDRQKEFQIDTANPTLYDVEADKSKVVMISLDGVGAKRQKDSRPTEKQDEPFFKKDSQEGPDDLRRAPEPKKRPKVETAVAHIESAEGKYLLTAKSMFELCKLILAFLLSHGLLRDRKLIFFLDGGRDIKQALDVIFRDIPHSVILDWFHLKKRCLELLSMGTKGGKKYRNQQYEIRRNLLRRLFVGNVDEAIKYLKDLPDDYVKNRNIIDSLCEYLNRKREAIICYALRNAFGYRISSNTVEKSNDLIVSNRQKGKGMSWSRSGSWALGAIALKYLNNENQNWREGRQISFNMYEKYGRPFEDRTDKADIGNAA